MSAVIFDDQVEIGPPENVELRLDDDGVKRWWISTRDGWQHAGHKGRVLELDADHFNVGTKIELVEPLE